MPRTACCRRRLPAPRDAIERTHRAAPPGRALQVVTAEDGEDALRKLDAEDADRPFVLVLTDVLMPFMDGVELARAIRGREKGGSAPRRLRIIGVSANGDDHACRRDCSEAGMDDVMAKPLRNEAIKKVLTEFS